MSDAQYEDLGFGFEIQRSNSTKLVVKATSVNGKEMIDIRTYYLDKGTNKYKPTSKGTTVDLEHARKFMLRFRKMYLAMQEAQLLP